MSDAMLRVPGVIKKVGLCRITIWKKIKDGTFPAPIELGPNSIGWPEVEITTWLKSQPRRTYGGREYRPADQDLEESPPVPAAGST